MTGRRAIISLCMLCALACSAFAAQGAAAASNGTTAFTCAGAAGGKGFSKEHCKAADAVETGANFAHVEIAEGTKTEITLTNGKTNAETNGATSTRFHGVTSGVEMEFEATTVHGIGTMENRKDPVTGEHYVQGSGKTVYSEVTVVKPAGKGCVVTTDEEIPPVGVMTGSETKGVVDTQELTATTKGQGHALLFTPTVGAAFARFWVTGCSIPALNHTYEVTGSVKTTSIDGATSTFTRADTTTQNTLKLNGQKAGIDGIVTFSGRASSPDPYKPLVGTTVSTP